jgi:hypothetical protein
MFVLEAGVFSRPLLGFRAMENSLVYVSVIGHIDGLNRPNTRLSVPFDN